jgi:hypothetical protein
MEVIMPAKKILKKPGPNLSHWFLNGNHSCGCRFRTDDKLVWCSGINCPFVVTKAYFMAWYWYDKKTGVFVKLPF